MSTGPKDGLGNRNISYSKIKVVVFLIIIELLRRDLSVGLGNSWSVKSPNSRDMRKAGKGR